MEPTPNLKTFTKKVRGSGHQPDEYKDSVQLDQIKKYQSYIRGRGYLQPGEILLEDISSACRVDQKVVNNHLERLKGDRNWPYESHLVSVTSESGRAVTRKRFLRAEELLHLLLNSPLGLRWEPDQPGLFDDEKTRNKRITEDERLRHEAEAELHGLRDAQRKNYVHWPELEQMPVVDVSDVAPDSAQAIQETKRIEKLMSLLSNKDEPVDDIEGGVKDGAEVLTVTTTAIAHELGFADRLAYYENVGKVIALARQGVWFATDDLCAMLHVTRRWLRGKSQFEAHGIIWHRVTLNGVTHWAAKPPKQPETLLPGTANHAIREDDTIYGEEP